VVTVPIVFFAPSAWFLILIGVLVAYLVFRLVQALLTVLGRVGSIAAMIGL